MTPNSDSLQRRPRRWSLAGLSALAALALVASACSDDDEPQAEPSATESAAPASAAPSSPSASPSEGPEEPTKVMAYPAPNTPAAMPESEISLRGLAPDAAADAVTVTGSKSGEHTGKVEPHSDNEGASFVPDEPFTNGETVTVKTDLPVVGAVSGSYSFTVATPTAEEIKLDPRSLGQGNTNPGKYASRPDLEPPLPTVTQHDDGSTESEILLAPKLGGGQQGPEIVDADGNLLWFKPVSNSQTDPRATDLRVQEYDGKPVLTWWQGTHEQGYGYGECVIYDQSYNEVAKVEGGNGYGVDLHDCVLTDRGTMLIMAYEPVKYDLSSVKGPKSGTVFNNVVQEIDVKTGHVLFEWDSLAHVPLTDSKMKYTGGPYDYFHVNSVAEDPDGNLLVSARNTWGLYEISKETGEIEWTMGSTSSDFRLDPKSTLFAFQHDAYWVDDSTLALFDNGAGAPPNLVDPVHTSRGLLLTVDRDAKTVTLKQAFVAPQGQPPSWHQGNIEILDNGNVMVGWGSYGAYSEFTADGSMIYNAVLPKGYDSYRAYTMDWSGQPTSPPDVAVTGNDAGKVTVAASWNGATEVAKWELLAGADEGSMESIGTANKASFETQLSGQTDATMVQVKALDADGNELGASKVVPVG